VPPVLASIEFVTKSNLWLPLSGGSHKFGRNLPPEGGSHTNNSRTHWTQTSVGKSEIAAARLRTGECLDDRRVARHSCLLDPCQRCVEMLPKPAQLFRALRPIHSVPVFFRCRDRHDSTLRSAANAAGDALATPRASGPTHLPDLRRTAPGAFPDQDFASRVSAPRVARTDSPAQSNG
jgi:hypothetical protein